MEAAAAAAGSDEVLPTGAMTLWTLTSPNSPVCRSHDSSCVPTRGTWSLDSQYLHNSANAVRTAATLPSPAISPPIATSSTRSQPPGLTSRAMRSRTRWGFGSCAYGCDYYDFAERTTVLERRLGGGGGGFGFLFSSSRKNKTYVYEEESDVNYVERTRFPGQGID
jgi:hypothetical protein